MKKKDLHKIAPKLCEISLNKIGFEIPKNYFETIEDSVLTELKAKNLHHKINIETFKTPENYFNSVEDIVIAKLKSEVVQNKNDVTIPENYFDTIEETVITKIKASPKVISLKSRFVKFVIPISIAASLLLIFVLNNKSTSVSFESLSSSEIENWINNGNIDFNALNIASMYPEIELNNEIFSSIISDDEVLEYIYEEDFDELIYEN